MPRRRTKTSKRSKRKAIRRRVSASKRRRGGRLHFSRPLHSTKKAFYKHFGKYHLESRKRYENNHRRKSLKDRLGEYFHQWTDVIESPSDPRLLAPHERITASLFPPGNHESKGTDYDVRERRLPRKLMRLLEPNPVSSPVDKAASNDLLAHVIEAATAGKEMAKQLPITNVAEQLPTPSVSSPASVSASKPRYHVKIPEAVSTSMRPRLASRTTSRPVWRP